MFDELVTFIRGMRAAVEAEQFPTAMLDAEGSLTYAELAGRGWRFTPGCGCRMCREAREPVQPRS
jgi:hypothetical protein